MNIHQKAHTYAAWQAKPELRRALLTVLLNACPAFRFKVQPINGSAAHVVEFRATNLFEALDGLRDAWQQRGERVTITHIPQ